MTFDPTSVEVTCVTLPKDHCVQVPWEYINVCGYSDEFCKLPHTYTHILRTYYVHTTYYILHTTYRISDHIVSLRRDKNWKQILCLVGKKKKKKKKTVNFSLFSSQWIISFVIKTFNFVKKIRYDKPPINLTERPIKLKYFSTNHRIRLMKK